MALNGDTHYSDRIETARLVLAELEASGIVDLELEIGCSHGDLLLKLANRFPEKYFVGIEVNKEKAVKAFRRAQAKGLRNVAIMQLEGYEFVKTCVTRPIFNRVHVYFPTPEPKLIGLEVPLISTQFVSELERVMLLGGEFRLATDHERYFFRAVRCFGESKWMAQVWNAPNIRLLDGLVVGSGCEVKYRLREKREIHVAALRLIACD
jgi:tRNA G46 methylase TrmB